MSRSKLRKTGRPRGRPTDRATSGVVAGFGPALAQARRAAGLSQHDLSARTGVTQGGISLVERGRVGVSLRLAAALAAGVGRSLDSLLADAAEFGPRQ